MRINFSDRIKQILKERDWNFSEMARVCGVTKTTISNWVHGESTPRLFELPDLAAKLNVKPTWLFGEDDEPVIVIDTPADPAVERSKRIGQAMDLFAAGKITEETLNQLIKSLN